MKLNKKYLSIIMITLVVIISIFNNNVSAKNFNETDKLTFEEIFPDPNFAKLIANNLNKEIFDIVQEEDLLKVEYLDLTTSRNKYDIEDIYDITGIGLLKNIKYIDLSNSYIISIPDEIENLSKVETLNFNNNQLVYISDNLNKLPNLKRIDFSRRNHNLTSNLLNFKYEKDFIYSNVPVKYLPQSKIRYNKNGAPILIEVIKPDLSNKKGIEIGGNLETENLYKFSKNNSLVELKLNELPTYLYDEYYHANEGSEVIYGSNGELVKVLGNYEYYCNLDDYLINGKYPNGKYKGNYSEFSILKDNETTERVKLYSGIYSGYFTTYGDYWPVIPSSDTASNSDPVPNRPNHSAYYGDRIGTRNNKLKIGDVAPRRSLEIPYGTRLYVTVQASDTNGSGRITKEMTVKDIMGASQPILDIWRWDNPDWFTGEPRNPDDLYFGQKYSKYLSFSNRNNYFSIIN